VMRFSPDRPEQGTHVTFFRRKPACFRNAPTVFWTSSNRSFDQST
jgi:hypothetical protein